MIKPAIMRDLAAKVFYLPGPGRHGGEMAYNGCFSGIPGLRGNFGGVAAILSMITR